MNVAKSLIASLVLVVASLAPAAQATVINFNNLAGSSGGNYTYIQTGTAYTNSGFRFLGANADFLMTSNYSGGDTGYSAYNGTDFFMAYNMFTISSATAVPFKVNSIDLVKWNDYAAGTQATLTGNKAGGGTVTRIIDLNTIKNMDIHTGNDFTTYALSGFDNLSSLTITHNFNDYLAMDNLVVNATSVPEPSSLALFGLAMAACAFVRRRAGKAS